MKVDIYTSVGVEVKSQDNTTTTEENTRKVFRNLSLEDAKKKANEFFDSIPDNATNAYFECHKSYNEQMDAALQSI
jgi:hypothetical protein